MVVGSVSVCRVLFFFFSSKRRHTRFDCDWSSDVCSSDLISWDRLGAPGSPRRSANRQRHITDLIVAVEPDRSEEHTSELQHSQISYAVFCLKKKRPLSRPYR